MLDIFIFLIDICIVIIICVCIYFKQYTLNRKFIYKNERIQYVTRKPSK